MTFANVIAYVLAAFLMVCGGGCALVFISGRSNGKELEAVGSAIVFLGSAWFVAWLGGF